MDGVCRMKREFSIDFPTMNKEWKIVVENFDEGVQITNQQFEDGKWVEFETINISHCVSELLFKTLAKDFDDGNIGTF